LHPAGLGQVLDRLLGFFLDAYATTAKAKNSSSIKPSSQNDTAAKLAQSLR